MKVAVLMGSDSDLPRLEPCLSTLRELEIGFEARVLSAHRTPADLVAFVEKAPSAGIGVFVCAAGGAAHLAGVVAAHTDLPVLGIPIDNPPLGGLDALLSTVQMPGGVPVAAFVEAAPANGIGVFVCAAGGAAHLAGVVASKTLRPVLGIPMGTALGGLDSLLSTVQMPAGIPVGTLAIGKAGAVNAALLAAAVLARSDDAIEGRLRAYREAQSAKILADPDPSL